MTTPRICVRCKVLITPPDQEHICKDVLQRHERRWRQAKVVEAILLARTGVDRATVRLAAEEIVAALARMGVDQE